MVFKVPEFLKTCLRFFPEFIDSFVDTGFFPFLFGVFSIFVVLIVVKRLGE